MVSRYTWTSISHPKDVLNLWMGAHFMLQIAVMDPQWGDNTETMAPSSEFVLNSKKLYILLIFLKCLIKILIF